MSKDKFYLEETENKVKILFKKLLEAFLTEISKGKILLNILTLIYRDN